MPSRIGVHDTTIHRFQDVLLKAVKSYQEKVKRERPESAAANPEYEQLTELGMAVQNPTTGIFDKAFRLLFLIVKERREYLQKESLDERSIEVDKKKLLDELTRLDEFIDEVS